MHHYKIKFKNFEKARACIRSNLIFLILGFSFFSSYSPSFGKQYIATLGTIWLFSLDYKQLLDTIRNSIILKLIIAFTAWITLTIVLSSDPSSMFSGNFKKYLTYYFLPILVISTSIKKEHIPHIIKAFIVGMLLNEIISYGMHFNLIKNDFFGFELTGDSQNPVPFLGSHIEYTTFLAFTITASFFTISQSKNVYTKILLAIFIVSMTTNMFITNGRTGQFILIASSLILMLIYLRHNIKLMLAGTGLLFLTFFLGYNISENVHTRANQAVADIHKLIDKKDFNSSWGIRLSTYIIIPQIIEKQPWYGYGYNAVDKEVQKIHIENFGKNTVFERQYGQLHNTFINILAGTGFIGLGLFLLLLYKSFTLHIDSPYLSFIRHAFLLTLIFNGFSSTLFWQREVLLLSSIFLSIIIVLTKKVKNDEYA